MNKILILGISTLLSTTVMSQKTEDVIRYLLFDSVEIKADSIISNLEKSKFKLHYYCLLTRDSSRFNLSIFYYRDKNVKSIPQIVLKTNRYVVVNKRLVPIIFDYDLLFTTPRKDDSVFRERDGNIIRMSFTSEAPIIHFNKRGEILQ